MYVVVVLSDFLFNVFIQQSKRKQQLACSEFLVLRMFQFATVIG